MANWVTLDTNVLLPGQPYTSAKALAMYENPIAIAEGATGAPRIPAGSVVSTYGFERGSGSGTTTISANTLGLVDFLEIEIYISITGGNNTETTLDVDIRFSSDDGASFGSWTEVLSRGSGVSSSVNGRNRVIISMAEGQYFSDNDEGSISIPAGANAAEVRCVRSVGGVSGGSAVSVIAVSGKGQRL